MVDTKSPPQVETGVSRIGFPIRRIRRPYDGVFMPYTTFRHAPSNNTWSLGYLMNC